ncbi:MAG: methionine synthase [Treponema sp.]|jgi:5-methyltetrahydrofolate--homocysteine methyltransferase|nr:methionine synthase [Treponema sp.]
MTTRERLDRIAAERILILDGAMGTMIQQFKLTEKDFRGRRFADHPAALEGCNDALCLASPWVISGIHEAYLRSGADIIETCSFNSTSISLADYGLEDLAYELSAAAASIARKSADKFSTSEKPRFVAGSMGPTSKSASISPDMDDPGCRNVSWDELEAAYYDNARGLLDGGADILLIETVFDTLNAKAAIAAVERLQEERRRQGLAEAPLMISATVSDAAGRLLSGQTVEAFCVSVLHARPWSLGLNCSLGAEKLKPCLADLSRAAPCLISAHPNAGMPNQFGEYDENPISMAAQIEEYMDEGLINIAGGCCGSTPAHIAVIAARAQSHKPRTPPERSGTFLAGLETLRIGGPAGFTDAGERTNVAGSRKFLRLIKEEKYAEALTIAREMIENGASIIDVCMDDALLDAKTAMVRFLNMALSDPDIARVPVMIDSSRWEVIEAALKCIQGKSLVNSISLKEGEDEFLRRAALARHYGAAVVVMLFDEAGQAADYERKIETARRSWELLTGNGFPPGDIVFDPNVLTVATGMAEHDSYGLDFIRACRWIKEHCPGAQISGGVSNLSFSFRGNEPVREALHSVFLKHAIDAGLAMAIVNPASLLPYDDVDRTLRDAAEDVVLNRKGGTAERLLVLAEKTMAKTGETEAALSASQWRSRNAEDRIVYAMIKGIDDYIEADVLELRKSFRRSLEIVEGPLMKGMYEVGDRFGAGKMFLPQVIRAARVMKKAVAVLEPFIEEEKTAALREDPRTAAGNGAVLLATVKGDVHDIGKNIVGVVLGCNGYRILDLGVMIPAETIINAAEKERVGAVGLSGLITPSLDEMIRTAAAMESRGLRIPLLIGGAATSLAHTALKIAPAYSGPVVYVRDASQCPGAVRSLFSDTERPRFLETLEEHYREAAERHVSIQSKLELLPLEEARKNRISPAEVPAPKVREIIELGDYPLERIIPLIDWQAFLYTWNLNVSGTPEAAGEKAKLLEDARSALDRIVSGETPLRLGGTLGFFPARSDGDDVILYDPAQNRKSAGTEIARFSFLRNQTKKRAGGANLCLADFTGADSGGWIGLFVLSAGFGLKEAEAEYRKRGDDYGALLLSSLANTLAEAFSEEVHRRVRLEWWGYAPEEKLSAEDLVKGTYKGIRPAFGYPACPDHEDKRTVFKLLEAQKRCGAALTESAMIIPAASVCGMYLAHPSACYFGTGSIGEDQLADWASRKGIGAEEARRRIGRI